jgi:hypothetical protein
MGLRLDGGRRPVKEMEEKSSVPELWPTCQFCKQDGERKSLREEVELYLVIHSDEAEEA